MPDVTLVLLAGVVAAVGALVLVRRPDLCVALWVAVEVTNASDTLADDLGVSLWQPVMVLAALSVGFGLVRRHLAGDGGGPTGSSAALVGVVVVFVLFTALQVFSLWVNGDVSEVAEAFPPLLRSMVFVAVLTGASRLVDPLLVVRAFVVPLALLGAFTVLDYLVLGGSQSLLGFSVVSDALGEGAVTPRYSGPAGDPNIWGRVVLLGVPFAASLALRAHQGGRRGATLGWLGALLGVLGGLYLAQSRGALLGLLVAGVVWWLLVGVKPVAVRRSVPWVLLAVLAIPGVGSRLLSLNQLFGGERVSDYALVERAAAQRVAFEMFRENPLIGVGDPFARFQDYAQYADIVFTRQVNTHNLYLQLAATGGVLLLLTWLGLLLVAVVAALRVIAASSREPAPPTSSERLLAAACVAALAGWSVASIFLHLGFIRTVLVPICLCAVLAARTPTRPLRRTEAPTAVAPALGLAMVRLGVLALVLGLGVVVSRTAASERVWQASVPVVVLPDAQAEGATVDGYQYDVVTRDIVIPTYAAIVESAGQERPAPDGTAVTATGDPARAIVRVDVSAPTRRLATGTAERVASDGSDFINAKPSLSTLATASPAGVTATETGGTDERRFLAGLVLSLLVGLVAAGGPWWRRLGRRPVQAPTSR